MSKKNAKSEAVKAVKVELTPEQKTAREAERRVAKLDAVKEAALAKYSKGGEHHKKTGWYHTFTGKFGYDEAHQKYVAEVVCAVTKQNMSVFTSDLFQKRALVKITKSVLGMLEQPSEAKPESKRSVRSRKVA